MPTSRWRCRCSLLPHCPPDTSRTGALQAFVPPAARTPTAGAGRGLLRPAPRERRTGLLDLECSARS